MSAHGEALAQADRIDDAIAIARRALKFVEPTDALADKADAAMALARVLLAAGRRDEAVTTAKAAAESYQTKGHTVGVEAAAQLAGQASESVVAVAPAAATTTGADVLGSRPSGL